MDIASRDLRSDASERTAQEPPSPDRRDGLVAALLRAATWLDEAGHALRLEGSQRVADHLILEGGYARDAALNAMLEQNDENRPKLGDGAGHAPHPL